MSAQRRPATSVTLQPLEMDTRWSYACDAFVTGEETDHQIRRSCNGGINDSSQSEPATPNRLTSHDPPAAPARLALVQYPSGLGPPCVPRSCRTGVRRSGLPSAARADGPVHLRGPSCRTGRAACSCRRASASPTSRPLAHPPGRAGLHPAERRRGTSGHRGRRPTAGTWDRAPGSRGRGCGCADQVGSRHGLTEARYRLQPWSWPTRSSTRSNAGASSEAPSRRTAPGSTRSKRLASA